MTNLECIQKMTVEEMARHDITLMQDNVTKSKLYITGDKNVFSNRKQAIQHEIEWLNSECEVVE